MPLTVSGTSPAALPGAGSARRATDAFYPRPLGFHNISNGYAENQRHDKYHNRIFHCMLLSLLLISYYYFANLYSALNCLFVFAINATTIATITSTAISPPTNPAPGAPVVISVPI